MARKARTHFAVLGLLCWKPMSGYDIKKMVEVALTFFWSESYGQIFPVLNRLVDDGLATKKIDPASGGRRRQVYTVTASGRKIFEDWLALPSSRPQLRDEMKLKFFLSSRSTKAEGIRLIEEYHEQQREHLEMLQESEMILKAAIKNEDLPEELSYLINTLGWSDKPAANQSEAYELLVFYLTLRSGVLMTEARVAWAEEVLPILRKSK
jgi:PadR family transcriptional regulator, regulatory protein AphA